MENNCYEKDNSRMVQISRRGTMIPKEITEAVIKKQIRERKERDAKLTSRKEEAYKEVNRLVEVFNNIDPHLERIILFGSLATGTVRSLDFDIDLSFEGSEFYLCVSEALKSSFRVDLVDYRACARHIKEEIDTTGRIIYDAGS